MAPFLLMSWLARSCGSAVAPRKRRRRAPAALEIATLPADVLFEIVAHTDFFTLVRCAAVCKHLRRDILSLPFICRISQEVAPCIIADLCTYNNIPLILVHPPTPAAASFCYDCLSPFMSRSSADILREYDPVTSRRGLVVLNRRPRTVRGKFNHLHIIRPEYERNFDLCVYDPMTGQCTFLAKPPGFNSSMSSSQKYVLLTSVDGIDDSFMLLFASKWGGSIQVHAATSSSSTWELVANKERHHQFPWWSVKLYNDPAVLHGGILHWLTHQGDQIVYYDVSTSMPGLMKLPPTNHKPNQVQLATSSDGNLLKLLTIEGFKISVWLQLPTVPTDGGGGGDWSLKNVIDIEEKIWPVCPNIPLGAGTDVVVEFEGFGKRSGDVMLLQVQKKIHRIVLVVLDLKTKEMHVHKGGSNFLEIDLSCRQQTMKLFS